MTKNNTALAAVRQIDPFIEWVDITPEMAAEWLKRNHGNRAKRRLHIAKYARDISNGNWLQTGDAVRFDVNGRMVDGQHRCEAIVMAGVPIRTLVIRGLDPEVQTVIDGNISRSSTDSLWSSIAESRTSGKGDPRLALTRAFNRFSRESRTNPAIGEVLGLFLRAWNAWRAGKEVATFNLGTPSRPINVPEPK